MAIKYVRKTGNDTTGDGSTGTPWLTISKALAAGSSAAGDTIKVGDGTYAEDTSALGYFYVNRNVADWITVESESVDASKVIVTGLNHATGNIAFSGARYIHFKNLTLKMYGTTPAYTVSLTGTNSFLKFTGCVFHALPTSAGSRSGLQVGGTVNLTSLTLDSCTFTQTGNDVALGLWITLTTGQTADTITVINTSANVVGIALQLVGCTNVTVTGGNWLSKTTYAGIWGVDGQTSPQATTGAITGSYFRSHLSHALLLGHGCTNVALTDVHVIGGDHGLVFKECTGCTATNCVAVQGTKTTLAHALYLKAATNATIIRCTFFGNQADAIVHVGVGSPTANKAGNITFTNNTVVCTGAATVFNWEGDSGDSGGCICDNNKYILAGTGNFGSVRDDASVANIRELKLSWSGYAVNDANSYVPVRQNARTLGRN